MTTLWEKLSGIKNYEILITCDNCGLKQKLRVPKGMSVSDFAKSGMALCKNCGCGVQLSYYKTQWLK